MIKEVIVTPNNFFEAYDEIESLISNDTDIQLVFPKSEMIQTDEDIRKYTAFIAILSALVIEQAEAGHTVNVSPITDIITMQERTNLKKDSKFLMCNNCPCFHCTPCSEVFVEKTKTEYFPPKNYCMKAFLEMECARQIAIGIGLPEDTVSDVKYDDMKWLALQLYGSSLAKQAGTYYDVNGNLS